MNAARELWVRLQRIESRLLDGVLAVALAVAAGVQFLSEEPANVARLLPISMTCLPLILRRRYPIVTHFLQIAAAIASQRQPVSISLLAIFIGVYSVAIYSRWRRHYLLWLLIGSAWLGYSFPDSAPSMPAWALMLVAGFGVWFAGSAVRDRQLRGDVLEERALRLERESDLSLRLARADERERIARELHDVVAHSVSVMVVQAGAARTLLDKDPRRSTESLLAVEATGRLALAELRHLLGLLTITDSERLAPQPGLEQLPALVQRVGSAGLRVDLHIEGLPRPLTPGLDLTAYRIIQEALTNALKYANGASSRVVVRYEPEELRIEVLDTGGTPRESANGAGRGLLGMQERVALYGGELEARQRGEGGFTVRARLPLEAR